MYIYDFYCNIKALNIIEYVTIAIRRHGLSHNNYIKFRKYMTDKDVPLIVELGHPLFDICKKWFKGLTEQSLSNIDTFVITLE